MGAPLQEQLELLRKRVAQIDRQYGKPEPKVPIAEALGAREVETAAGRHLELERLYGAEGRHGSFELGRLPALPAGLLEALEIPASEPGRWAFLDTETTGLAGGSGTLAFLTGIGWIAPEGFRVRQWFLRDHSEEASALTAIAETLSGFDVLLTYNGKSFDQPLLETRYRLNRIKPPFARLAHLDLLYGARRLWRLRHESCRLVELERRVLGHERVGDVPGNSIPDLYFSFLRTGRAAPLKPVLEHNALDILSLACLTAIVPQAHHAPEGLHALELLGVARWLREAERFEDAAALLRRAVDGDLPDAQLFKALWELAQIERKCGRPDAALAVYADLARSRNPFRNDALIELAKHYEHREKNAALALEFARSAGDAKRIARLEKRAAGPRNARLL